MFGSGSELDFPQKSLQIKQDDKFFSRLLSKENSKANSSFRVYYGGVSVAVPFVWESQPGTPKHKFNENTLPPLTPPPSYFMNYSEKPAKKHSRSKLFQLLFPRLNLKKINVTPSLSPSSVLPPSPSSTSWSSSFNSSIFSPSATPRKCGQRRRFSSRGLSFDSRAWALEEEAPVGSPTSTVCFGVSRRAWWS